MLLEFIYKFKDTWGRFSPSVDHLTIIPDNPQANDMSFKKYILDRYPIHMLRACILTHSIVWYVRKLTLREKISQKKNYARNSFGIKIMMMKNAMKWKLFSNKHECAE